jgi:hypothetical protein
MLLGVTGIKFQQRMKYFLIMLNKEYCKKLLQMNVFELSEY